MSVRLVLILIAASSLCACRRQPTALTSGPDLREHVAVEVINSMCWDPRGPFPQRIGRISIRHRGGAPAVEASVLDGGAFAIELGRALLEPGSVVEADVSVCSNDVSAGALSLFFVYASTEILGTHVAEVSLENAGAVRSSEVLTGLCGELPTGFYRGHWVHDPSRPVAHACPAVPARVAEDPGTRIARCGAFATAVDPSGWDGDVVVGEAVSGALDYLVAYLEVEGEIDAAGGNPHRQYGFAFDADGDPGNDYAPAPDFAGDFFAGTDRWYEVRRRPGEPWTLRVTDARDNRFATMTSAARAVAIGRYLVIAIPRDELPATNWRFRASAFSHRGDFGLQPPHRWSGMAAPAVGEPLSSTR